MVPVVEHLHGFAGVARKVDALHVVGFGKRFHLVGSVVLRADRDQAAGAAADAVEVAAEVLQYRPDDLGGDDVLRKLDLRLGEPLSVRRLDGTVRAEVAAIRRRRGISLVLAALEPLELCLLYTSPSPRD